jgi:NAD-dependent SIR2 family protein deacetylase
MRALHIPGCPRCGGVARPNILMFGDYSWLGDRTERQESLFGTFLEETRGCETVVIEMGAGTAIPTIRGMSERLGRRRGVTVVRINPREPWIDEPHLSVAEGSLSALKKIDAMLPDGRKD